MGKSNVGRPKKDSRHFNFNLNSGLYDDLAKVCAITGRTKTDEIECMMRKYVQAFKKADGTISGTKAFYCVANAPDDMPIYHECIVLEDDEKSGKVKIYWGGISVVERSHITYEEPLGYGK